MKKSIFYLAAITAIALVFSSCTKEEDFDEALLAGTWKLDGGTEMYLYNSGGTGVFWDPAQDVTVDEGKQFNWTLSKSDLTHIFISESGSFEVPKAYTVTELTATSLQYKDDLGGTSYSFTKQ